MPARVLPGIGLFVLCAACAPGRAVVAEPTTTTASIRKSSPALGLPPVDFNHPPRDYVTNQVSHWTLFVESQMVQEDPDLARRAMNRLNEKLVEAMAVLPASASAPLRHLKFFLLYGEKSRHGGRNNGLQYFRKSAPDHNRHLDPRMASSIVIYSASNFVWLSEFWALKALVHELAHAHHLEQWPERRADIYDAWAHAKEAGLYRNIQDDRGRTLSQGYALQNHLEYYAELSCIYFVNGNYYPFNRANLRHYDPRGFQLIERLWGIRDGSVRPLQEKAGGRVVPHSAPTSRSKSE